MKKSRKNIWIAIVISALFVSCVDDEGIDFPDAGQIDIVKSTAIVSLLSNLASKDNTLQENEQCFRFKYPIVLGYNNDSNITIENFEGLQRIISTQSSNFNITGLQFPVEVTFKNADSSIRIQDEAKLLGLLSECDYTSLREDFDRLFRQCFTFDYPIVALDNTQNEVSLNTDQEFNTFYTAQNANYQLDVKFPINLLVGPDAKSKKIETYFELYEIINACVGCPDIKFDTELLQNNEYQFITDFEIGTGYELFFKVNGDIIQDVVIDGTAFTREFSPGTYEVCIQAKTPDCPLSTELCKTIEAEVICLGLSFTSEMISANPISYQFEPMVTGLPQGTDVDIKWYVNDEFIQNITNLENFVREFNEPGVYKICGKISSSISCPNGVEFCDEITIQ